MAPLTQQPLPPYQPADESGASLTLVNPVVLLTLIADVFSPVEGAVEAQQAGVVEGGGVDVTAVVMVHDAQALLPQVAHEELQADQGEDAEAEDGEDHYVRQLLHRLDQGAHDGLQA